MRSEINFKYILLSVCLICSSLTYSCPIYENKYSDVSTSGDIITDNVCDLPGYAVSILNLLGNPDQFVNKRVVFIGYLSYRLEDVGIYPSKEFYDANMIESKINISRKSKLDLYCDIRPLAERYVWVKGLFRKFSESNIKNTYAECMIPDQYVLEVEEISDWDKVNKELESLRNDPKVIEKWKKVQEKNKDKYREMEERCKNRKKE